VGASLQWERVFSESEFSVGASLQWEPVFSGCQFSVGVSFQWVRAFSGSPSSVGASLQWVLLKIQEKDYKLNILVYSINQDIKRCFNIF
jgi:hypothetical protein